MKKYLLIAFILILPSFSLLLRPGFFPFHDNLQPLRQLQMHKCFLDLQIPCRWVPDMGFGYGYPLFNYYPPLPYLIGLPFVVLALQNIDAVKITIIVASLVGAGFMFAFLRSVFMNFKVALVGSILFTYAPYRAVDIYVRGAINELWAISLFPAIFWSIYKICKENSRPHIWMLSIWVAGILLSHNPTAMIFFPAAALWTAGCLIKGQLKNIMALLFSGLLGLGLASFFTLPVIFEQGLVHINTLTIGYFNYLAHFVSLAQLFINPNWGYGGSELGTGDGMSFFIGYLHWLFPLLTFPVLFLKRKINSIFLIFALITVYASFMTHVRSSFIWDFFPTLEYLQFPWRFLSLLVFSTSFLAAYISLAINRKLIPIVLALILILNYHYFTPQNWTSSETDASVFSSASWQRLIQASIFDYLPISAPYPPSEPAKGDYTLVSGSGSIQLLKKNSKEFQLSVDMSSSGTLRINQFYFPGWIGDINGARVNVYPDPSDEIGRINIDVPQGKSLIKIQFLNTHIRSIANIISVLSMIILLIFIFKPYAKKP